MKKLCIIFGLLIIIILTAAVGLISGGAEDVYPSEYLRIHIRANSNSVRDQDVKYKVRDSIVEYLTPLLAECGTLSAAVSAVDGATDGIERAADNVLKSEGFSYSAVAEVRREEFPTRVYEDVTLPAGEYTALIIELGAGEGDNWWCVAYPPLCFTGGDNVVYKSKIAEIISGFFSR